MSLAQVSEEQVCLQRNVRGQTMFGAQHSTTGQREDRAPMARNHTARQANAKTGPRWREINKPGCKHFKPAKRLSFRPFVWLTLTRVFAREPSQTYVVPHDDQVNSIKEVAAQIVNSFGQFFSSGA